MAQEGAAGIAAAVAESVQYQGRKASRRGSEQRRQDILDAAMRIVVRDGVRAVRHRAVAAEAGVPLSATTYYFKDFDAYWGAQMRVEHLWQDKDEWWRKAVLNTARMGWFSSVPRPTVCRQPCIAG